MTDVVLESSCLFSSLFSFSSFSLPSLFFLCLHHLMCCACCLTERFTSCVSFILLKSEVHEGSLFLFFMTRRRGRMKEDERKRCPQREVKFKMLIIPLLCLLVSRFLSLDVCVNKMHLHASSFSICS